MCIVCTQSIAGKILLRAFKAYQELNILYYYYDDVKLIFTAL